MGVIFARRGRHQLVYAVELHDNEIQVEYAHRKSSIALPDIQSMQYEGLANSTRADVLHAPFPRDGQRILVFTLADRTELRVRVEYDHDTKLKELASRLLRPS